MTNSSKLRVVVVDDEAPARRRLRRLAAQCEGVEVVGEAADAFEALTVIAQSEVDVLLLDVQMPDMDGTKLASKLSDLSLPRTPMVILVTAHAEHAVEAFDLDVVDYVLKPARQARLAKALDRARARLEGPAAPTGPPSVDTDPSKLVARLGTSSYLLDPSEIGRLHAADKYVIARIDTREYVLDESLSELERRLGPDFIRVHRAELVNMGHIVALHGDDGSTTVELRDGRRVPVSRRRVADLRRRLGL